MSVPLLELDEVRIDKDGRCVLESVTLCSSGDRIGLLGQGNGVFDALAGVADVVAGELRVEGTELSRARDSASFAVARPWPARSTVAVRDGLILAALLGGCTLESAKHNVQRSLSVLGLEPLAQYRLVGQRRVEHYLAGLAEAALFESPVIVVDWPIGVLDANAWVRFGTALSRLILHKRWMAWVPGPARLPVEHSWIGALDQLLWVESGMCVELGAASSERVRTLVVIDAVLDQLPEGLDTAEHRLERVRLSYPASQQRTAFVIELPRDECGRVVTDQVLAWCDRHGLALFRLDPLDRGF